MSFFQSEAFTFILLPVLIFFARICDVTLGTIRIIFVSRGLKYLAPVIGFVEILIWLVAIGKIMQNLGSVVCYVAYAGGFAAGNYMGILIEEKLAVGTFIIRIITKKDASELISALNADGYGATSIPGQGNEGRVHIIYTVIRRVDLKYVIDIIRRFNPKAFYSIEDVRFVREGIFPFRKSFYPKASLDLFKIFRKGK
ncbi:MAG TPA: DUF2179 domain-containing protein [Sedimentisphaerales bacterium]|nr:DUF2179 domain-containing protein [Sedimentisphaerales bacterium]